MLFNHFWNPVPAFLRKSPLLLGIYLSFLMVFSPHDALSHPNTSQVEQYLEQGRTQEASNLLQPSLQQSPDDPQLLTLSALIEVRRGNIEEAITFYEQALRHLPSDFHAQLVIFNNYFLALEYQERFLTEQITFLEKDENLEEISSVKSKIDQNHQSKLKILKNTQNIISQVTPNETVAQGYLNLGQISLAKQALFAAPPSPHIIPLYVEIASSQDDPRPLLTKGLSYADLSGKVQLLTALSDYDPAYLPDAIAHAQQAQLDEYLFQLYALQAQQGIEPKRSLKLAVSALSRLRIKLTSPHPEVTFFFQDKVIPVYRQYLSVLLDNPTQQDLQEARAVFDRLQIAQVENLFKELCFTTPIELEQVLAQKQAGLIQLIVLENAYHVLLSLPSGEIKHHQVTVNSSVLAEELIRWRQALLNPLNQSYQTTAQSLYQQIIAPFEAELSSLDQLLVIGDQYFRSIPFSALNDGDTYLIEKWPTTSLLSWNLLVNQPYQPNNLLAFGLEQARPPFVNPIPYAEEEAKAISQVISDSSVYVGSNFTKASLRQALLQKDPQLLHLAAHALFTGNPKDSVILTFDQSVNLFELQQLLRLPSSLRLLVLSACETSLGNNLATLGLAGVAARGGVESTVGTLWQADDEQALSLMVNFYQALAQGKHPALSLQQAQISAIRQRQHPAFWSLFLLIGG